MFENALFASDASGASDAVVSCLEGLRSLGTERILLVHALGIRHLAEMRRMLLPLVEPKLHAQVDRLERMGFRVEAEVAPGPAPEEICRAAKQRDASVIVVGSAGETLARDILLGGVALRVLHRAEVPVLVMHVRITDEAKRHCEVACGDLKAKVLFATDFSDVAEEAFSLVEQIVERGGKQVTLLHVQDRAHAHREVPEFAEKADRLDRSRLDRMAGRLRELGATDVRVELPCGNPKSEIAQRAEQGDYSLVVMGTRGRGSAGALILGSVAYHLVHHAVVPALLVPRAR